MSTQKREGPLGDTIPTKVAPDDQSSGSQKPETSKQVGCWRLPTPYVCPSTTSPRSE